MPDSSPESDRRKRRRKLRHRVDQIAIRLREIYTIELRLATKQLSGLPSTYGERCTFDQSPYRDDWRKLARRVLRGRMDPVLYLKRVFAGGTKHWPGRGYPTIRTIAEIDFTEVYREGQKDDEEMVGIELGSNSSIFKAHFGTEKHVSSRAGQSDRDVLTGVLLSSTHQVSCLFRYCVATTNGLNDVAEDFLNRAAMQYMARRTAYAKVWKEVLPKGFDRLAERVYLGQR